MTDKNLESPSFLSFHRWRTLYQEEARGSVRALPLAWVHKSLMEFSYMNRKGSCKWKVCGSPLSRLEKGAPRLATQKFSTKIFGQARRILKDSPSRSPRMSRSLRSLNGTFFKATATANFSLRELFDSVFFFFFFFWYLDQKTAAYALPNRLGPSLRSDKPGDLYGHRSSPICAHHHGLAGPKGPRGGDDRRASRSTRHGESPPAMLTDDRRVIFTDCDRSDLGAAWRRRPGRSDRWAPLRGAPDWLKAVHALENFRFAQIFQKLFCSAK